MGLTPTESQQVADLRNDISRMRAGYEELTKYFKATSSVGAAAVDITTHTANLAAHPDLRQLIAQAGQRTYLASFASTLPLGSWISLAGGDGLNYVAIAYNDNRVARSKDGGRTWEVAPALPLVASWMYIAGSGKNFVASAGGAVAYSTDGGQTWALSDFTASDSVGASALAALDENNFVALPAAGDRAAYSTDGGRSWTEVPLPVSSSGWAVAGQGAKVVAVPRNSNQAVYSKDGGKTWQVSILPLGTGWLSVAGAGTNFVAATYGVAAYSHDGGVTWAMVSLPVHGPALLAGDGINFIAIANATAFAATILHSTDSGHTWQASPGTEVLIWRGVAGSGANFAAVAFGSDQAAFHKLII